LLKGDSGFHGTLHCSFNHVARRRVSPIGRFLLATWPLALTLHPFAAVVPPPPSSYNPHPLPGTWRPGAARAVVPVGRRMPRACRRCGGQATCPQAVVVAGLQCRRTGAIRSASQSLQLQFVLRTMQGGRSGIRWTVAKGLVDDRTVPSGIARGRPAAHAVARHGLRRRLTP
jgi:hypothetical protein